MADLDELLREVLRSDGDRFQPKPIEAEIDFGHRLRLRRIRNGIGVVVMILALGAGAGLATRALTRPTSFVEPAPSIVPWIDARPTPEADQTPPPQASPSTPACKAQHLGARFIFGGAATGHDPTVIEFENFGSSKCALQGVPSITLIKASGGALPTTQSTGSFFPDNGNERVGVHAEGLEIGPLGSLPPDEPQIGRALLYFEWTDCLDDVISSVDVTLPDGGGTVRVPTSHDGNSPSLAQSNQAVCDGGAVIRPELAVNHFQSVPIPARNTLDYSHLSATIDVPTSVKAGDTLRYTVTITNNGTEDFRLDPCPAYSQALFKSGGLWLLNCAAAAPIKTDSSEIFEMKLDVPSFTPSGSQTIRWKILSDKGDATVASTSIMVLAS